MAIFIAHSSWLAEVEILGGDGPLQVAARQAAQGGVHQPHLVVVIDGDDGHVVHQQLLGLAVESGSCAAIQRVRGLLQQAVEGRIATSLIWL
ncbi:hypothetical protein D3C75_812280 [compost metagenome]